MAAPTTKAKEDVYAGWTEPIIPISKHVNEHKEEVQTLAFAKWFSMKSPLYINDSQPLQRVLEYSDIWLKKESFYSEPLGLGSIRKCIELPKDGKVMFPKEFDIITDVYVNGKSVCRGETNAFSTIQLNETVVPTKDLLPFHQRWAYYTPQIVLEWNCDEVMPDEIEIEGAFLPRMMRDPSLTEIIVRPLKYKDGMIGLCL